MKINEKNLSAFASSPTPVDRQGWLLKRGEVNKAFQRRWFILKGNLLFYLEKRGDKEPIGVVILEGCTIELADCDDQYSFKIVFHGTGSRTYTLCADSQELMEAWMKALSCASYDYMKLMVSELQTQLDDLIASEKKNKSSAALAVAPVVAPPRQRQNPFSVSTAAVTHVGKSRFNVSLGCNSGQQQSVTFIVLHSHYGGQIEQDRRDWKTLRQQHQQNQILVQL